jgi:inorganic pyrophosphatase/exopolyphosphatase
MKEKDTRKEPILSSEDAALLASAKIASSKAVRSSMALGITIKIIRGREIIAINPDKSIKVLRKILKSTIDISSLKKEMILERKYHCK